jgi:ABC-type multidrug transport system fused ATPase/permease subunit
LQPGQLVAFFGYATFLTTPLRTAIEYVIATTRAYVGAGRVLRILNVTPLVKEPDNPREWPSRIEVLEDTRSGIRLLRGALTAVVTDNADDATILADRLGRFVADVDDVLLNGISLNSFSVRDTRTNIAVSEIEPRLFSGELRYELVPHGLPTDSPILEALEASSALDILDALEEGLSTNVEERGRGFSGGQRQRLSLARALLRNSEVLILVDPTSAVDTHTEGRIASRLSDVRRGRTTMIATTSPLMLQHVDYIYVYRNGRVVSEGTHRDLLANSPDYREIVLRGDS